MIPVHEPLLDGREGEYLQECIRSGWISAGGPFVERLEREVATRVGRKHGIAVCNGTAALQVAVDALRLGPGDEVVMPALTIISCAAAVVRAGAVPVFADVRPDTWNLDTDALAALITPRTKAIMPVHIYGLPVDMDPVLALAARHGLAVIEDAAQALGQTYRGRPCGSFGEVSVLSFYANKHLTTGEGGMLLTDDDELAVRARSLRDLCFGPPRRFVHAELGWNFRLTNLQAAVGVAQLEALDAHLARKRALGARYDTLLSEVRGLALPVSSTPYAENAYWVYGVVMEEGARVGADELALQLAARGVDTRPFFWPLHQQPALLERGLGAGVRLPVAERLARRGLYLPSGVALRTEQQETVARAVREIMA